MSRVTKHNGEQEGESNDGIDRRVHLPVGRYTVCVDERLERTGELVGSEESGRGLRGLHLVENGSYCAAGALSTAAECQLYSLHVQPWDPALGNQTLLAGVQVEVVQSVVDSFYLTNFHKPNLHLNKFNYKLQKKESI